MVDGKWDVIKTQTYFRVELASQPGDRVLVVGNCNELGNWNPEHGLVLTTSPLYYPCWYSEDSVALPSKKDIEYKYCYIKRSDGSNADEIDNVQWEEFITNDDNNHRIGTNNRRLTPQGAILIVEDEGGKYRSRFLPSSNKTNISELEKDNSIAGLRKFGVHLERRNSRKKADQFNINKITPDVYEGQHKTCAEAQSAANYLFAPVDSRNIMNNEVDDRELSVYYIAGDLPIAVEKVITTDEFGKDSEIWKLRAKSEQVAPSLWENRDQLSLSLNYTLWFVGQPVLLTPANTQQDRIEIEKLLEKFNCIPVWLDGLQGHFRRFQNYLWHVFHQNIITTRTDNPMISKASSDARFDSICPGYSNDDRIAWDAYRLASDQYIRVLMKHACQGDVLWFNDLYCLTMPTKARQKLRGCKLGLFIHVPFPSSEIFRMLPSAKDILQGILAVDAVGFQFFEYVRHFLVCCKRLLALDFFFKTGGSLCVESGTDTGSRLIHVVTQHAVLQADQVLNAIKDLSQYKGTWRSKLSGYNYANSQNNPIINNINININDSQDYDENDYQLSPSLSSRPGFEMEIEAPPPVPLVDNVFIDHADNGYLTIESLFAAQNNENPTSNFSLNGSPIIKVQSSMEVPRGKALPELLGSPHLDNEESLEHIMYNNSPSGYTSHSPLMPLYKNTSGREGSLYEVAKMLRLNDHPDEVFHFVAIDRLATISSLRGKFIAIYMWLTSHEASVAGRRVVFRQYCYESHNPFNSSWSISLVKELQQQVDFINNRFGRNSPHGFVVSLEIGNFDAFERKAIFLSGDSYMNTSWRDGLCLDPYEYILVRGTHPNWWKSDRKCIKARVILSEFVGSASTLSSAKRVNPWDDYAVCEAFTWAYYDYDPRSWEKSFWDDYIRLKAGSVVRWASQITKEIITSYKSQEKYPQSGGAYPMESPQSAPALARAPLSYLCEDKVNKLVSDFKKASCRVIFLDHEGTLTDGAPSLSNGLKADGSAPNATVLNYLERLASVDSFNVSDVRTYIVIMSGRDRSYLEKWFSSCQDLGMAAEHGFFIKYPGRRDQWIQTVVEDSSNNWKHITKLMMESHVAKTYGAKVENKGSAITFQYRNADPDFGSWSARELEGVLTELLAPEPCEVLSGKGYVEVRQINVNKGVAAVNILEYLRENHKQPDFILAIGDDRSDEDTFKHIIQSSQLTLESTTDQSDARKSLPMNYGLVGSLQRSWTSISSQHFVQPTVNTIAKNGEKVYTCTVGRKPSAAQFFVNSSEDVISILRQMVRSMPS